MATSDRGFASMDDEMQKKIASDGGKANGSGSTSSSQNTQQSEAGKMGAKAQPTEAKAKGGHNSHGGGTSS